MLDEDKAIRCIREHKLAKRGVLIFDGSDSGQVIDALRFKVRFRLNGLEPTVLMVHNAEKPQHFMQMVSECLETHFAAKLVERRSYVLCLTSASPRVRRLAQFLSAIYVRGIWLVIHDRRNKVTAQNQSLRWLGDTTPCPGQLETLGGLMVKEL